MSAYAEGLRDAWEGELFGDLLLRGLSEQLDLPEERRAIFRTLADIEAAMAARLEPLLEPLLVLVPLRVPQPLYQQPPPLHLHQLIHQGAQQKLVV